MKKTIFILAALAASAMPAAARDIVPVGVDSISFDRHGDYMVLDMQLDLRPSAVRSGRAQVLTPLIVSENGDTAALTPVGIYGRQRYLQYERNGRHPLGGESESVIRSADRPGDFAYHSDTPWLPWMADSRLVVRRRVYGCADCLIEERTDPVTSYFRQNPMIPEIVYFPAGEQEPKTEVFDGSAFVDFRVDRTNIDPTYRDNVRELGKIQATIDTVIRDKDVTITGVWLKGYASPESPYSHNTDLAKGRTEAIKNHIRQLYRFPADIIRTDYEPENWDGLRKAVESSNIDHREEILALIGSDMAPDPKEAEIKRRFPQQYKFMLQNFYPPLRHTDYRIICSVNRFDDIPKIREVMKTRPGRLSLREFFLLGNAAEPGSDEFNEVYETAARIYPGNSTANINAANAALQRKDYATAAQYLSRAGDSPEAVYARGSLAFLEGDYDRAEELMKAASAIPQSQSTLDEIARIRAHKDGKVTRLELK